MVDAFILDRREQPRRRTAEELRLRQDELAARGGPSTTTLTKVENAVPPSPASVTLRKLDAGLGWTAGSASAVLAGGDPLIRYEDLPAPNGQVRQRELGARSVSEEERLDPGVLAVYRQAGRPELERRVHQDLGRLRPDQIAGLLAAIEYDSLEDIYTQASAIQPGNSRRSG